MSTFICYSRDNSDFVVRLARDLKAAGFDVWLDQLDIPKGARWDDAIEEAVERSSTFMIVLSPESIESQSVKDELSYAIDSGKHILPVVIRPSKIPFRLRRFQYVDFTDKPYKDSLADIKHLLSNTQRLEPAPAPDLGQPDSAPVVHGALLPKDRAFSSAALREPEAEKDKPQRKLVVPMILGVLVLAGIMAAVVFATNQNDSPPAATTSTPSENPPTITPELSPTPLPPPVQVIDAAGVAMRRIGAGEFIMGSDQMADEGPEQTVYLDTVYVDKYEVTNARYRECIEAGGCEEPAEAASGPENLPAVNVDWNMARAYCEWRGARLPTEAEWEKAARGSDGRMYPWGNDISCKEANFFGCEGTLAAVTSYVDGMSIFGVYNMAGNVAEWVSSLYMAYPYDPGDGREDPDRQGERVLRGGSWLESDTDNDARTARRHPADPSTASDNIGFRCARDPDQALTQLTATPANNLTATSHVATSAPERTQEAEEEESSLISNPTPAATRPVLTTPTVRPTASPTAGSSNTNTPQPTDTDLPQPTATNP
ncbi:MAG TPA: SUMF1/EgtB/PvdO family nonheme iron enzyme, partial [Anaerolineales bacterium]|nr:SUMF1/EgtB/PvdO family nonheme iron enzyme [Anaerolineales bacterium]